MSPRVADLTVDELQALLRVTMREVVEELVEDILEEKYGMLVDPDEGLEMRPEFEQSLDEFLASDQRGDDADEVFFRLGLD